MSVLEHGRLADRLAADDDYTRAFDGDVFLVAVVPELLNDSELGAKNASLAPRTRSYCASTALAMVAIIDAFSAFKGSPGRLVVKRSQ